MGSPANSSSLITSWNPWPLPLSACSQPSLPRLRLMPMLSMDTTAMATTSAMPTTATTAIPMPTMDTTTARGPLMPRPPLRLLLPPRLMLMPSMPPMPTDMASTILMPTDITPTDMVLDTTAMLIPMPTSDTTARGLLMLRLPPLLRPMLMLTTDTTAMPTPTDTDMPTVPMDTMATPTVTDTDTTDKM